MNYTPPVVIHSQTPRPPTLLEEIDEAAREYSNVEEVREHFRAGARWATDEEDCESPPLWFFLLFLAILWNLCCFGAGLFTGDARTSHYYYATEISEGCRLDRPWDYLTAAYCPGERAKRWFMMPSKK